MRHATLFIAVSLLLPGLAASAAVPYGYQPAGYYRYPAPVAYPRVPGFNPAYPVTYQRPYRSAPFYPYPPAMERKAPERITSEAENATVAVARPVTAIKPQVIDPVEPQKHETEALIADGKLAFLEKIAPLVLLVNKEVATERGELIRLIDRMDSGDELNDEQTGWLKSRLKKYRVKAEHTDSAELRESLLPKIDVIPVELALAQAANESAWGKSRFAREAQNLFGIWTYDESKGIVPEQRAKGAKHLVRKYESMEASVRHYINLLNSHPAYRQLRDIRAQLRQKGQRPDGLSMAQGLIKYSARGEQYIAIIRSMISDNNLTDFRSA